MFDSVSILHPLEQVWEPGSVTRWRGLPPFPVPANAIAWWLAVRFDRGVWEVTDPIEWLL